MLTFFGICSSRILNKNPFFVSLWPRLINTSKILYHRNANILLMPFWQYTAVYLYTMPAIKLRYIASE